MPRSASTASAAAKIGLRPQMSALRPTRMATGTITIWAAMMQTDISVVPRSRLTSASFCPTSGNIAAFAK